MVGRMGEADDEVDEEGKDSNSDSSPRYTWKHEAWPSWALKTRR